MVEWLIWGCFVNWYGGEGKNIVNDVVQEICNDLFKDVVKGMGVNKMIKVIFRVFQLGVGVYEIKWLFDKVINIYRVF